nr:recombinase family protein [Pseudomonas luteola]
MPTAIPYLRFSSGLQQHGSSIERQERMIARWLEANPSYTLSTLRFQDLGISGYSGAHLENGFGKLLEAVKAGVFKDGDCILFEAIDRAGRLPPLQMLGIIGQILETGLSIITLDDGIVYTRESVGSQHLFLLVAKIQQAYQYSETLSRRMRESWISRRNNAATGKGIKRKLPVWLKEGKLRDEIAPFIVQTFEDFAAGLGARRLRQRLQGTHPELEKITPNGILGWLSNKTAIGYDGDIPNVHPPVVSLELWYRVQKALEDRKNTDTASPSKYLLSGLVKCGVCGANFVVKANKDRQLTMICATRSRLGDSCPNGKSFPFIVLDFVRKETSLSFLEKAFSLQQLSANGKRIAEIDGLLNDLFKSIGAIADSIAQLGPLPQFIEKIKNLQEEQEKLRDEKTILEREETPSNEMKSRVNAAVIEDDLLENDPLKLNALLQGAGYYITVYPDGLIKAEDEIYPFLYLGYSRKPMGYKVLFFGEEKVLRTIPKGFEMAPLPPLVHGDLRVLIARRGKRRI